MKGISKASLLLMAVLFQLACFGGDSTSKPPPELNAQVQFNGTQFVITNKDSFDWRNVKMELNEMFELMHDRMVAGQTYTVGAMQFAKTDGTRFNPFQMKNQKFSIKAETPNGTAWYFGSWNK